MKTIRTFLAFGGILLVMLLITLGVMKAQRAKADAAFIAAADLQTITLTIGGVERRSLIHVPQGGAEKTPRPLVLMFHGNGGTPENVIKETGWVAKSDREGFIIVFPEATRPDMSKPPKFGSNNPAWNDGSGRFHAGEQNIADVAFITALLDQLEARFAVDPRRVFATGFSNGASMAFRTGLELSERIAAIAPVSGALWIDAPQAEPSVSLLYITGDADPINPMDGGAPKMASGSGFKGVPEKAKPPVREMVRAWATLLGCAAEPQTLASSLEGITSVRYAGGRDGTEVVFTTIADHGHIWPGGINLLPAFLVGQATSRLKATDTIWEFFQLHPKPDARS
jgi:polyhydroxybutyrate depolymerase